MLRIRSSSTRFIPSSSAMAWPWAQVSICRAVTEERALMLGPAQATRSEGSAWLKASNTCR